MMVEIEIDPDEVLEKLPKKYIINFCKDWDYDLTDVVNITELKVLAESYKSNDEKFQALFSSFCYKYAGVIL